jgi:molybdopterin-guanine dinucleotide biosynthesis protein A
MFSAGFVLAGGASFRMGRDKALLPFAGGVLVEHVAREVEAAADSVTLLGDPALYGHLGWPVWNDLVPGRGPIGALYTALRRTEADWNLFVACDMPHIRRQDLALLLEQASTTEADCVAPLDEEKRSHPLCAAYHRRVLQAVTRALNDNHLKMQDLLATLQTAYTRAIGSEHLTNVNTPEEWLDACRTSC